MVGTVNANREYFETGVDDLVRPRRTTPAGSGRLLTHPVQGLENFRELIDTLSTARDVIKVFLRSG